MIFNASATYALRALALLASDGEQAVLGRDLARGVDVPSHYLSKILAALARAGVLTASRGLRGGYRLARPAEEIRLIEVVEPFEGKRVRPGCLLQPERPCRDDGPCSAHASWSDAKAAYLRFLESTTLANIRGKAEPLKRRTMKTPRRRRRH
jgi:Rrf2 family transcriptional regulator, nitric oxide-sensitive transcriptional repressor